jgi:hypothetical protein
MKDKSIPCTPADVRRCSCSPSDSVGAAGVDAGWGDERREKK